MNLIVGILTALVGILIGLFIKSFWLDVASFCVRTWLRLYTARLPNEIRFRRRAEIASDISDQIAFQRSRGYQPEAVGIQILVRCLLGSWDDMSWRFSLVEWPSINKRVFDLSMLVLLQVILAPLFLVLWTAIPLLIWLEDRDPIFHRWLFVGKGGRVFTGHKFRVVSIRAQVDPVTGAQILQPTKVGAVLQPTLLDRLPLTLAIWGGHMSLVGPPPMDIHRYAALENRIPEIYGRLKTRPGITGISQVSGETGTELGLRLDLDYVQRMSPWLDLKVLAITVRTALLH